MNETCPGVPILDIICSATKSKKLTKLICLLVCATLVSVWGWSIYKESKLRENELCAMEILRKIWQEQWLYGENSDSFRHLEFSRS